MEFDLDVASNTQQMCTNQNWKTVGRSLFPNGMLFERSFGPKSAHKCIQCGTHTVRWRALNYLFGILFVELISLTIIVVDLYAMYLSYICHDST